MIPTKNSSGNWVWSDGERSAQGASSLSLTRGASSPAGNTSGSPARLHSRYDPLAEAKKYAGTLGIKACEKYFILIEPGEGYLAAGIKKQRDNCKIVALHVDSRFRFIQQSDDIPAWYPDSPETVQDFLDREIPDSPASAIRIVEWRPALAIYGKAYLNIFAEAADFIKRADAAFRTAQHFGRRWLRNFFKNLAYINRILLYKSADCPIIVTGSGPSLEESIPRLRALADRPFVLAASSSVPALRAGGIRADMVISTDGGSWARSHLNCCFRVTDETAALAVNLSAALPSQSARYPFLILNDGSLWQTLVLAELGIPSVIVPQRGTVTASALELALVLSGGPVYLAGMDLSVRDIRTHARPYGFDYLFYGSASRARPLYSQYFVRARDTSGGGSLAIYAAWFRDRLKSWPKRIFALENGNTVFETAPARIESVSRNAQFKTVTQAGGPEKYRGRALVALIRNLDEPEFSAPLSGELGSLLFPGSQRNCPEEIKAELKELVKPYGAF